MAERVKRTRYKVWLKDPEIPVPRTTLNSRNKRICSNNGVNRVLTDNIQNSNDQAINIRGNEQLEMDFGGLQNIDNHADNIQLNEQSAEDVDMRLESTSLENSQVISFLIILGFCYFIFFL